MNAVCKMKGKRNCTWYRILIDKTVPFGRIRIVILFYMYAGLEQFNELMTDEGARFLTIEVGIYKSARVGGQNDPCNGLELETSVRTHVQLNVDTGDRNIHLCIYIGVLVCCGCVTITTTGLLKASKILGTRNLKSTCQQGCPLSGGYRGESVPCLFQLLVASHVPWLVAASVQSHFHNHIASSSLYVSPLCVSYIRIHVMTFRAHADNPGLSPYRKILNHNCKDHFPK